MLNIPLELYKNEMIEDLKNLIKIESVKAAGRPNMPYGKGIYDALVYIQGICEKMGFECFNLCGHMGYVDYGHGEKMLGVLTHVDVVPEGEGWTMSAFQGTEKNGRIYGRGAIDNKGPAIAALYALRALKDNGVQLDKKVRLLFGTDEETDWTDMEYYKKHERHPDIAFSPDGEYPLINTEKGLMHFELSQGFGRTQGDGVIVTSFNSGTRPNVVPNKAECAVAAPFADIKKSIAAYKCPIGGTLSCKEASGGAVNIFASGKSAHGSKPQIGINAAASLLKYLSTLPPAAGGIERAIRLLAEKIGTDIHGEGLGLDISDISGRLTLNLGTLLISNGALAAKIDIRYPVSYTKKFIDEKIEKFFAGFKIDYHFSLDPHYVPEDSPLVTALLEVYTEATGEKAYCISIGGATYARAFENAVTFGPIFPGMPSVEHGPDEYIEIDTLLKNMKIIANAIVKLCGIKT